MIEQKREQFSKVHLTSSSVFFFSFLYVSPGVSGRTQDTVQLPERPLTIFIQIAQPVREKTVELWHQHPVEKGSWLTGKFVYGFCTPFRLCCLEFRRWPVVWNLETTFLNFRCSIISLCFFKYVQPISNQNKSLFNVQYSLPAGGQPLGISLAGSTQFLFFTE